MAFVGKKVDLKVDFKIVRVPLPVSMVEARRASLLLLLDWFEEERRKDKGCSGVLRPQDETQNEKTMYPPISEENPP